MSILGWLVSLSRKVFIVARFYSISVIISNIISQILLLVSLLLPLKVIFMLGAGGVPSYFPELFQSIDYHSLIVSLTIGAFSTFILYLIFESIISALVKRAAVYISDKSDKLPFVPNQNQVVANYLGKALAIQADATFVFLVLAVIAFVYPEIIAVFSVYCLLIFSVLRLLRGTQLTSYIKRDVSFSAKLIATLSFFSVFGYVVYESLATRLHSILSAIVVLILLRQMLTRVTRFVSNLNALYTCRDKVDALFFHGKKLGNPMATDARQSASAFTEKLLQSLLSEMLKLSTSQIEIIEINYHYLGVRDIDCYFVTATIADRGKQTYFIKRFVGKTSVNAEKELSIVQETSGLPLLPFLASCISDEDYYLIYALPEEYLENGVQPCTSRLEQVAAISAGKLSIKLSNRYLRTHATLLDGFNQGLIVPLISANVSESTEQKDDFQQLCDRVEEVRDCLQDIPLCLVNLDLTRPGCAVRLGDRLFVLHWGSWELAPLGAAMPVNMSNKAKAIPFLEKLRQSVGGNSSVAQLWLSALAYRFYLEAQKKNIESMRTLATPLLAALDAVKVEESR